MRSEDLSVFGGSLGNSNLTIQRGDGPTTTARRKSMGWSQVRAQLKDWTKPALIALIKDLYEASTANRDFLNDRSQADENECAALEAYRRKIIEQFFPR